MKRRKVHFDADHESTPCMPMRNCIQLPFDVKRLICIFTTGSIEDPVADFDSNAYTRNPPKDSEEWRIRRQIEGMEPNHTPSTIAIRLSLISKDWYEAAYKFIFYQISLRDLSFPIRMGSSSDTMPPNTLPGRNKSKLWLRVAKRLTQPPHSKMFGANPDEGQLAGDLVRRLFVYSRNFSDSHQLAVIKSMLASRNIHSFFLSGPHTLPHLFRLTRSSYLIQSLYGIFSIIPSKIRTAVITLPMHPSAVPYLMSAMSLCDEMESLALRQDTSLSVQPDYGMYACGLRYKSLKNFLLEASYGGNYQYLGIMADAHTPKLTSFVMHGRSELKGLDTFFSEKLKTLKDVVAMYYGFEETGLLPIPTSSVLESVIVTYPHACELLQYSYSSLKYVGLSGPICNRVVYGLSCMDFVDLRMALERLANHISFPALTTIQLMEVSNEDLLGVPWQIVDNVAWEDLIKRFSGEVDEVSSTGKKVVLLDCKSEPLVKGGFEHAITPLNEVDGVGFFVGNEVEAWLEAHQGGNLMSEDEWLLDDQESVVSIEDGDPENGQGSVNDFVFVEGPLNAQGDYLPEMDVLQRGERIHYETRYCHTETNRLEDGESLLSDGWAPSLVEQEYEDEDDSLANEVMSHRQVDEGTLFGGDDNQDNSSTIAVFGDDDESNDGVEPSDIETLMREIFGPYDEDSDYESGPGERF